MTDTLHRFTASDYEDMAQLGLLPKRGIELLDGLVVKMSPRGDRHSWPVSELARQFILQGDGRFRTDPESLSLKLNDYSEPDPDVALSWPRADRLRPTPENVFLIIEVADSSLDKDRVQKSALYASAQIPEYWIVNLIDNQIEKYLSPVLDGYRERLVAARGELSPNALPDVRIDVTAVLGIDE